MLQVSRLWTYEVGVPYISQEHWKSKALAATLSDIEPKDDSKHKDDGISNAFTATVNPGDCLRYG